MEPSQVATMVISIAFGLVTFCWLATARANQRRHEDTVLLTYAAAWQRGDEQDLLVLGPVRRLVEERERKERALGSTRKSILGAAVPAVVGSGDPPAMNQDDKEDESEAEAGRGSFQPTPASHRGRSSSIANQAHCNASGRGVSSQPAVGRLFSRINRPAAQGPARACWRNRILPQPLGGPEGGDHMERRALTGYRLHGSTSAKSSHLYVVLMTNTLMSNNQTTTK
jgi:hypothetical protein